MPKPPVPLSLDAKHAEMVEHFHILKTETIPALIKQRRDLERKIKNNNTQLPIDVFLTIQDQILTIKEKIRQHKKEEKEYWLNNSKYIFNYYEEKKKIFHGENHKNEDALSVFFKISQPQPQPPPPPPPPNGIVSEISFPQPPQIHDQEIGSSEDHGSTTHFHVPNTSRKPKLYQQYWKNMNMDVSDGTIVAEGGDNELVTCEACHQGEMISHEEEGILICNNPNCGQFIAHIVDSMKANNKEPPSEVSYSCYERLNHFKEILSQFQAKETTIIPPEVIEAIRNRLKKERITDYSVLNYVKMRELLRKLNYNKYFEHTAYLCACFGVKPPQMSQELHDTLCVLFIEIQKPWARFCPKNRVNFFNYSFILYSLLKLLGQTQYLSYIPRLKDREKTLQQDLIWKEVCNDLDWEFYPSI